MNMCHQKGQAQPEQEHWYMKIVIKALAFAVDKHGYWLGQVVLIRRC